MMIDNPIQMKVQAKAKTNTLYLYGDVGGGFWTEGFTLQTVKEAAEGIDSDEVTIHIDSYGGNATEGVAIRNYLQDNFSTIHTVIDGIAASAASVIALSGDLTMPSGSTLMIHNPMTIAMGGVPEFEKAIGALQSLTKSYQDIYMQHFNGTTEELTDLMNNETWLTVEDAETYGFANQDQIENEEDEVESDDPPVNLAKVVAHAYLENKEESTDPEKEGAFFNEDKEEKISFAQGFKKLGGIK
ncbi:MULTISPECIES: head maturation protease, ClpP-related [Aerococcus]|uniref:head maturation protease, ClpP-related n=1 Tax=Aerococcus TaxID=1375 RepID=UPI000DCD2E9E|nr:MULTISPECIES: head maturation protease, ClpP-related [Aerococcus]KAA9232827.1 Clp protease ClpP [Aerococcus mictus]MDK6292540.1 Clp protease ClpP [Aerococcus urinae]MDK6374779.1 Clp protease ClpP [Aerococcus urinae]MDK6420196.1 Clp protease ClpP [Aerococcus urinae]RAV95754.1 Clp protease ClpP [Aerococcus mictus]